MKKPTPFTVNVNNLELSAYRIDHDVNGNPRYVIHFIDLDIKTEDYGKIKGLTKYRAKWFGGGYVFQSYSLQDDLKNYYLPLIAKHYSKEVK